MSTVQAHRVIKFRFIRLISILIKTLTPPYAIKGPRRSFLPHEERDGWTQRMDKSERKRKREKMSSPQPQGVRFSIAALADVS